MRPSPSPWSWISSLYFTQAVPLLFVSTVAIILFKGRGISNTEITFWTGFLYLPWVVKGLWSPIVEHCKTRRHWIIAMEYLIAIAIGTIGLFMPIPYWFIATVILLWLTALASATHDIAADGYYMDALNDHQQVFFSGIRNTFYRIGNIATQGGMIYLVGRILETQPDKAIAWQYTLWITAALFIGLATYHFFILPRQIETPIPLNPSNDTQIPFIEAFRSFFKIEGIWGGLCFILMYRFAESQLEKVGPLFLMDAVEAGGLALSESDIGIIKGTIGVICLLVGGITGSFLAARNGLKYWLWPMVFAMNIPNIIYVLLAYFQPTCGDFGIAGTFIVGLGVGIEQLGYGFGFSAFMLYMLCLVEKSPYRTAHYAILTGFMALGMMLPGMFSGHIQVFLGYPFFFVWIVICTIPSFLSVFLIRIPEQFGVKKS